ncbi:MAG: deoxyribonuclease IV [Candidatus Vogelbacteria bacterium]|nr:deoxyribonuclease IV [Candidatus Vogelbacteria bacterium]
MKNINPIGAHFSVSKGFRGAFEEAVSIGAEAMQVFAKSPIQARLKSLTKEEAEAVTNFPDRKKIKSLVVHASYLLNFAKPFSGDSFEAKSLAEDIFNADALGGDGAVIHLGKSLKMDKREAIKNYVENIKKAVEETDGSQASVILENTAGQGSEFGFLFEELGDIYKAIVDQLTTKVGRGRVRVCVDTQHSFGAGYDWRDKKLAEKAITDLDKYIGIKNIACVHFNDSKKPLGSRVDRHEDIGYGAIGIEGLKNFVFELREFGGNDIPLILETPEGFESYTKQIWEIKSW